MNITSEVISRFWEKVNKADSCWNWTAATFQGNGYGMFSIEHHPYRAHRVSWVLSYGKIPENLYVLHTCDNRLCVNPGHLWVGTHIDNMQDMWNKGRGVATENYLSGEAAPQAKLTEEQVLYIRENCSTYSQRELASMFKVMRSTIRHVIKGTTWKHLL